MMLSVLIPAYNEADVIEETVTSIAQTLSATGQDYEILVINDGSTDTTEALLCRLEEKKSKLRHLNNTGNHGYGYAVRFGLDSYRGDAVVVVMADGSDSPADVAAYFDRIREGYDCAFGSRFIAGAQIENYPRFKRVLNRLGNRLIGLFLRSSYSDFTNGFKCFRRNVIEDMHPLVSGQFNLTIEMSIKAVSGGANIAVIPTSWYDRNAGHSKFIVMGQVWLYLMTIVYCLLQAWLVPRIGKPVRQDQSPT
jgi:dolichol-phosphate mannosyltransferase